MRCYTIKEKLTMAWSDFVRFVKIITLTVVGCAIVATTLCIAWTYRENKEMKQQIAEMEEANSKKEESNKGRTKYIVVVDEMTGKIIYTDYR